MKEPKAAKKCIGYLPELPPLYMEMTVREYLDFAAELVGLSGKNKRDQVENVMELVKVFDVQQRLIRNLSKGYRQRVGLAQALLGYPDILILDEPMVGLDPQQIIEIRELIRDLAKEHTVILSSHILGEVSELCDEILIISKGKLVASGTPEHLEEMMKGAGSLELLVKGTEREAREILGGVPGIRQIDCASGREEGTVQLTLQPEDGQDIREAASAFPCRSQTNPGGCIPGGNRRRGGAGRCGRFIRERFSPTFRPWWGMRLSYSSSLRWASILWYIT